MVSILCIEEKSNYRLIPGLDLWDKDRNAYNFSGGQPVITHAPCAQWSRMKAFARSNKAEKELAYFCFEQVQKNGGIFEHPSGSSFFRVINADRKKIRSVNQCWWGFPAQKKTLLYFNQVEPLSFPVNFNAVEYMISTPKNKHGRNLPEMKKAERSLMPLSFCQWLVSHFEI